jgi:hypothetical protein
VAKDRAKPFSRKHRRYWLPVTGGMILIGLINVALGLCTYEEPRAPQRIEVAPDANGSLGLGEIPAPVMRAFALKYPRTLPRTVERRADGTYVLAFPPGAPRVRATFASDGTFVREE